MNDSSYHRAVARIVVPESVKMPACQRLLRAADALVTANGGTRRRKQERKSNANQKHPAQIGAGGFVGHVNASYRPEQEAGKDHGGQHGAQNSRPRTEYGGG